MAIPSKRTAGAPDAIQGLVFSIGIHGNEEIAVTKSGQLAVGGKPHQGSALDYAAIPAGEVIEKGTIENEETCARPTLQLGLFGKRIDSPVIIEFQNSEAGNGLHDRHRPNLPVRVVELQQFSDIDVRQAVAIGHHENVAVDKGLDPLDPSSGHGIRAGVYQRDAKALLVMGAVILDLPPPDPKEIVKSLFIAS